MRLIGGALFLATAALCAQSSAPADSGKTYHSDAMSFDFAYPSSFTAPGPAAAENPNSSCATTPVAVTDMRTNFNMISVKEYDEACMKKKQAEVPGLGTAATSYLNDTLALLGTPALSSTANYDLGGRNASTVAGTVKLSGAQGNNTVHGAVSCISTGKGIACFQFLSNDCSSLALITASTVKFVGTVAMPIIPAGIGAACKP